MTTLADVLAAHQPQPDNPQWCKCTYGKVLSAQVNCNVGHQAEAVAAAGLQVIPTPDVDKVAEAAMCAFYGVGAWDDSGRFSKTVWRRVASAAVEAVTG